MLMSGKPLLTYTCVLSLTTWVVWKVFLSARRRRKKTHEAAHQPVTTVVVVDKWADWDETAPTFLPVCYQHMVVGFDCEWTNNKGPVSLLQLANSEGQCALVRLCRFQPPYEIPQSLLKLLADPLVLKVGVNPSMDAAKLFKDYQIAVNGHLDIGWLAFEVTKNNVSSYGLKGLAHQFLGVTMDKSFEVRCSDWDAQSLTQRQIDYAAGDAYIAVRIFHTLVGARLSLWDKFRWLCTSHVPWGRPNSAIRNRVNRPFSASKVQTQKFEISRSLQSASVKQQRVESKLLGSVRKSPLYHNCILQAPDGQPLCTCSTKKAKWYLEQSLADLVLEDPLIVRLRFEPGGRPSGPNDYYLQNKENICVVCGRSDWMIRKNVIPQEYRRHFPFGLKEHKSHDVVLLCFSCHQFSNMQDMMFKQQLAERFNAPLGSGDNTRVKENTELKTIRSAARALLKENIPDSRRQELQAIVCEHFHVTELTPDVLDEALHLDVRMENAEYVQHGYQVVKQMEQTEGLLVLEQMWRQHFLLTNSPKYLPKMWSVTHRQSTTDILN